MADTPPTIPARTSPPTWTTKLCPILSLATLREPAKIQGLNGARPPPAQASSCQGGKCMFFIPQLDAATGRPDGDGVCCVTLFPIAINQLGTMHAQIANAFAGTAKPEQQLQVEAPPDSVTLPDSI